MMPLGEYPFSPLYGWVQDRFGVSWQLYTGGDGGAKEKYVPTLMFVGENNGRAKEAIDFYTKKLHFELVEDTYQAEQDKRWVVVSVVLRASHLLYDYSHLFLVDKIACGGHVCFAVGIEH